MIKRIYEIVCDTCGWAQHFQGNSRIAERQFGGYGGIVTRDKKHYCDKTCYDKRNEKK